MYLLPGYSVEYKKRHDEIWPELAELKEKGIYCAPFGPSYVRFVTHLGFDDSALQAFTERISE